ncbi:MAG: hypothetical protein QOJ42_5260 [Acidobacteriaceae bacterium]|jgi:hypothetical protein|nr:hypothetical protein [Acidobacteriaceae bacterium]
MITRDDKGEGDLLWKMASEWKAFFITYGPATTFYMSATLSFVIPSDLQFYGPFLDMFFDRVQRS